MAEKFLDIKKGPNFGTPFTQQLNKNQTTHKLILIATMESRRLLMQ